MRGATPMSPHESEIDASRRKPKVVCGKCSVASGVFAGSRDRGRREAAAGRRAADRSHRPEACFDTPLPGDTRLDTARNGLRQTRELLLPVVMQLREQRPRRRARSDAASTLRPISCRLDRPAVRRRPCATAGAARIPSSLRLPATSGRRARAHSGVDRRACRALQPIDTKPARVRRY